MSVRYVPKNGIEVEQFLIFGEDTIFPHFHSELQVFTPISNGGMSPVLHPLVYELSLIYSHLFLFRLITTTLPSLQLFQIPSPIAPYPSPQRRETHTKLGHLVLQSLGTSSPTEALPGSSNMEEGD